MSVPVKELELSRDSNSAGDHALRDISEFNSLLALNYSARSIILYAFPCRALSKILHCKT